jgi:hypothetical protein
MMDTCEGPTIILIVLINICQIYVYLIPPAVIFIISSIIFYLYSSPAMVQCKQIDLNNKTPIFQFYN